MLKTCSLAWNIPLTGAGNCDKLRFSEQTSVSLSTFGKMMIKQMINITLIEVATIKHVFYQHFPECNQTRMSVFVHKDLAPFPKPSSVEFFKLKKKKQ